MKWILNYPGRDFFYPRIFVSGNFKWWYSKSFAMDKMWRMVESSHNKSWMLDFRKAFSWSAKLSKSRFLEKQSNFGWRMENVFQSIRFRSWNNFTSLQLLVQIWKCPGILVVSTIIVYWYNLWDSNFLTSLAPTSYWELSIESSVRRGRQSCQQYFGPCG